MKKKKSNKYFLFISFIIAILIISVYAIYDNVSKIFVSQTGVDPLTYYKAVQEIDEGSQTASFLDLQQNIDVLHYDINIEINTIKKNINGDVTIKIKNYNPSVVSFKLNFYNNLEIKKIDLNGEEVKYKREERLLTIYSNKNVDTANIRIQYNGTPKDLGFGSFSFDNYNNSPVVYSLNEPVFASTWLPCVDTPDDKALVDMKITNDSNYTSLSNGKLISVNKNGTKKTFHWKTYYPISTYLIAIYSGKYLTVSQKYVSINKETMDLNYYSFPSDIEKVKKDFEDHPKYIETFEKIFGNYPFIKEKYSVAEFLWQNGAMEHQTITGIGSNFVSGKKFFSDMLIHELAHHWWGDAVGPKSWKDLWLNEGFATYSEALYWEKNAGFSALQSTMKNKFDYFEKGTLYNPIEDIFSRLVYDKGAWVLHMLRKEVGDPNFFIILRKYFENYKYSNASTEDFKHVCESISKKNLTQFFNQWIYKGKGIIKLAYDWSSEKNNPGYKFVFNTEQLQNGYNIYKFQLEIKIIFADNTFETKTVSINNKSDRFYLTFSKEPKNVEVDPDKWLLAEFESRNE